jgi:tetratricopeptide (TPR) repeat protein
MRKSLTLLIFLSLLAPAGALAGSPAFDAAVQQFKARRYSAAVAGFQAALRANPTDAASHYYMALCYQSMNQMAQARQEYQWVITRGNNAQLRSFATSGISQLGKYQTSYSGYAPQTPSGRTVPAPGVVPHVSGRLKVLEFYADW